MAVTAAAPVEGAEARAGQVATGAAAEAIAVDAAATIVPPAARIG